jgi:ubiquinone/menaquinone biosynthesis C-methylase UbiE
MYDEREDFREHQAEIDAMVSVLAGVGVHLSQSMTVLDLGAGQGMHAGFLSVLAGKVFCADVCDYSSLYNGEFLKLIDEKYRRNNVEFRRDRVAFHQTDAMELIYRDALFDCVISVNSFEHIPDPGKALAEMIRVTRPGGHIYISTDPVWTADTGSHFFHRVAEPWAHLVYGDDAFASKMLTNEATNDEVDEFRRAMNRWRVEDYAKAIRRSVGKQSVDVLHEDSWSGVVSESHRKHENLNRLLLRGFTKSELLIRGLRWVLKKR